MTNAPIGIFDSGYGGLTISSEIRKLLPQYDYIYLGDNARAPYGTRSFEVIYDFTLQAVNKLFDMGCPLIILACNTASSKALRNIQMNMLPVSEDPTRRVLGVIRPTVEVLSSVSTNGHIGVLGTPGTISSHSYQMEIAKLYPHMAVSEEACPMWVPLVETGETESPGADYFIRKHLDNLFKKDDSIDTIILGCTHYPILRPKIKRLVTSTIKILAQGEYVASSLKDYLQRHPEMENRISKNGQIQYLTTENPGRFADFASIFLSDPIQAEHIKID
ncbi:glutamate racemase [Porphyromonas macacae]|uniref:Glutamate racemase n=1 Tax=Porphyromonas macacae TaxID=28115 RepID=A0A0A2E7M3_9PORP|nr:glutamate racemase [Porphyromonas macacae]KGN72459.1 glutamate racemase [Porphyromonas macacae]